MEGSITIAQEHAGGVGTIASSTTICYDDVEFTVSVHIAQGHEAWVSSRGEGLLALEAAIAIA